MNEIECQKAIKLYIAKHDQDEGVRDMPFIENKTPTNWTKIETYIVENTFKYGTLKCPRPCLTYEQFLFNVKIGHGYGIVESGYSYVRVAEFIKRGKDNDNNNN